MLYGLDHGNLGSFAINGFFEKWQKVKTLHWDNSSQTSLHSLLIFLGYVLGKDFYSLPSYLNLRNNQPPLNISIGTYGLGTPGCLLWAIVPVLCALLLCSVVTLSFPSLWVPSLYQCLLPSAPAGRTQPLTSFQKMFKSSLPGQSTQPGKWCIFGASLRAESADGFSDMKAPMLCPFFRFSFQFFLPAFCQSSALSL